MYVLLGISLIEIDLRVPKAFPILLLFLFLFLGDCSNASMQLSIVVCYIYLTVFFEHESTHVSACKLSDKFSPEKVLTLSRLGFFSTFWTVWGWGGSPPSNSENIKATAMKLSGCIVRLKLFPSRSAS